MPANLPPDYFAAEERYRKAKSAGEKIEALEEMFAVMPKHKGTDKLRADIRRRIAKHRDDAQQKKGTSKHKTAFSIDREGAAQVVVIGAPNAGKSSLVARLTKASPEVADFPHTTHKPMPGMASYENIQFQLVDTPPLTREYVDPLMGDLIRRADIVAILLDLHAGPLQQLEDILGILAAFRIYPQGFPLPEALTKAPFVKRVLLVVNKMDGEKEKEDFETFRELAGISLPVVGISITGGMHLDVFLKTLYGLSGVIRVYTKSPGKEPDRGQPFVVPAGSTLEELAAKIHKDFVEKLKYAKIWGRAVHDGQMVHRDHIMQDGDIVEIHT